MFQIFFYDQWKMQKIQMQKQNVDVLEYLSVMRNGPERERESKM